MRYVMSWLMMVCLIGAVAVSTVYAQPAGGEPDKVVPAEVNSDPCATPRRSVATFDLSVQGKEQDLEQAARCFDFNGFKASREEQLQIPVKLKTILNSRGIDIQLSRIPDNASYVNEASLKSEYDFLGKRLEGVELLKVDNKWMFSSKSVAKIPALYDQTFAFGIEQLAGRLPVELHIKVLGVKAWKYLALVLFFALAVILSMVLQRLASRAFLKVARRAKLSWGESAVKSAQQPMRLVLASALLYPFISELTLPAQPTRVLLLAIQIAVAGAVVIIVWRLIDVFCTFLTNKATKTDTKLDDQLVPLARKTMKFVLLIVATLFILQNLNVDVGSLLAGLGLGGLAIALAAKDTLANVFGSVTIFADRPFQIGDWVSVSGIEGTVEEVGFRSTRIRTFYKSLVTVPNSTVANATIDNFGERTMRRLKFTLSLTYETTPDQMEAYVEGVRAILASNSGIVKSSFEVHFYAFSGSSLDVLVYSFMDVATWTEELRQRQNIFLECMRLAKAIGVSFAYPTQTLHIDSHNNGPLPGQALASREELASIVEGFGPQGERTFSERGPLTETGFMPGTLSRGDE